MTICFDGSSCLYNEPRSYTISAELPKLYSYLRSLGQASRKSYIELSTYLRIIETSKTMKGKATMALVLSLVVGIIINYGVMTPTAKVFATAIGEHQPQPPPEANQDPLSEQQRYNAAAMKVLSQMSTPV
ncbi:MAG TPA: hypothetical protein VE223_06315, partial [Nitrososphaeraceae archaeon]|nr:hypothetical protein [Nitrososphaeraceae archaeon]